MKPNDGKRHPANVAGQTPNRRAFAELAIDLAAIQCGSSLFAATLSNSPFRRFVIYGSETAVVSQCSQDAI